MSVPPLVDFPPHPRTVRIQLEQSQKERKMGNSQQHTQVGERKTGCKVRTLRRRRLEEVARMCDK